LNILYIYYRAISNAQHVKKWAFIGGDFTVDGGELTPTLKLKRKVANEKNRAVIDSLYIDAKL
jgi:long-subunit acyl-CoA synthetase (AMP-forming)